MILCLKIRCQPFGVNRIEAAARHPFFLWVVAYPERLSTAIRAAIDDPDNDTFVSAATCWEMAIKVARGRLDFPMQKFRDTIEAFGFLVLPIALEHAVSAGALPRHHADPFDRMLIAQAQVEGLTLVTVDAQMRLYEVPTLGV